MAERRPVPAPPWRGDPEEAGRRGRLVVSDRAVQRLAEAAARSVPGVARTAETTSGVGSALGRGLPRVHCDVAGSRVRVEASIATRWPAPAAAVAAAVRDTVGERLRTLAGLRVDQTVVTVAKVVPPGAEPPRRLR